MTDALTDALAQIAAAEALADEWEGTDFDGVAYRQRRWPSDSKAHAGQALRAVLAAASADAAEDEQYAAEEAEAEAILAAERVAKETGTEPDYSNVPVAPPRVTDADRLAAAFQAGAAYGAYDHWCGNPSDRPDPAPDYDGWRATQKWS